MKKLYVYEIFLDELLITNSGESKFYSEELARKDAQNFIFDLIKNDSLYYEDKEEDFDIILSEITEEDFQRGW